MTTRALACCCAALFACQTTATSAPDDLGALDFAAADLASAGADLRRAPDLAPSTAVRWQTGCVILEADRFSIEVGTVWTTETGPFSVRSSVQTATDCDLLVDWTAGGEARHFYMAFKSDGLEWWWDATRFSRGSMAPDWEYTRIDEFRTPIGSTHSESGGYTIGNTPGGVSFDRVRVKAFP